jgi:hypothetical protein
VSHGVADARAAINQPSQATVAHETDAGSPRPLPVAPELVGATMPDV